MTPLAVAIRRATDDGILVRLTASSSGSVRVLAVRKARRGRRYADAKSGELSERFDEHELAGRVTEALDALETL